MTARFLTAWQSGDISTLVSLSTPPFFFDQEILISENDVRAKYAEGLAQQKPTFTIDRIMSGTIGEFRQQGIVSDSDRLLSSIQLSDDDLVVVVIISTETLRGEGVGFYYRRFESRVEMAGFWD